MSKSKVPIVLRIPFHWLKHNQSLGYLLFLEMKVHRKKIHSLLPRFAFCCDEKLFVMNLLRNKTNYWVFRSNQQERCGDFTVIDMSSPNPKHRKVWVIDLKLQSPLRVGGGGAGIQFYKASSAITAIANTTGILTSTSDFELLSGDRRAILSYLGVPLHITT